MAKNRAMGKKRRAGQMFSSMVYCGECSGAFGSKTWGNNTPYRRRVWQCNEKYRTKGKVNCNTPFVTDEECLSRGILVRTWTQKPRSTKFWLHYYAKVRYWPPPKDGKLIVHMPRYG